MNFCFRFRQERNEKGERSLSFSTTFCTFAMINSCASKTQFTIQTPSDEKESANRLHLRAGRLRTQKR